jgi:hypothetical protein
MALNHIITNKGAFNISTACAFKKSTANCFISQKALNYSASGFNIPHPNFNKPVSHNESIKHFSTQCRAKNRIGPHNLDIISTIYGLLLGDGYANNRSGEGVRIAIKQSEIHKEYLFFLYNFFLDRGYSSKLQPRKYLRRIKGKDKIYYGYEFNTFTFRSFV